MDYYKKYLKYKKKYLILKLQYSGSKYNNDGYIRYNYTASNYRNLSSEYQEFVLNEICNIAKNRWLLNVGGDFYEGHDFVKEECEQIEEIYDTKNLYLKDNINIRNTYLYDPNLYYYVVLYEDNTTHNLLGFLKVYYLETIYNYKTKVYDHLYELSISVSFTWIEENYNNEIFKYLKNRTEDKPSLLMRRELYRELLNKHQNIGNILLLSNSVTPSSILLKSELGYSNNIDYLYELYDEKTINYIKNIGGDNTVYYKFLYNNDPLLL